MKEHFLKYVSERDGESTLVLYNVRSSSHIRKDPTEGARDKTLFY